MFISPDPLLAFRGERGTFQKREQIQWKDSTKKIRKLYFDHKFKQCAALCNDTLTGKPAHPLDGTFLHFYAAICYESLGILAHNYSNNKLSFLNQARDHFTAALATLPLPYSTETGTYNFHDASPQVLESSPSLSSIYDPTSPTPLPQLKISEPASDTLSGEDSDGESYISCAPDCDKYTSLRPDIIVVAPDDNDEGLSPCKLTFDQRKRLSQSLSAGHIVQEALLPKPLFAKKIASFPSTPAPRALPPIPAREPVLRKTALQTFLNPSVFTIFESSPVTPRLCQIREIFDPKMRPALQDRHLKRYNSLLSGFRTQLLRHITSVDVNITKAMALQIDRQRNKTSRLASFWSVKQEDVEVGEKQERIERLRKEGWNITKRSHGWKGKEYYEELRRTALADVGC